MQSTSATWKALAARLGMPDYTPGTQVLTMYSGNVPVYQTGSDKHVTLYFGEQKIYDSDMQQTVEVYSGGTRVYSSGHIEEYAETVTLETRVTIDGTVYDENITYPTITRALTQNGLSVGNVTSALCQFSILTDDAIPRAAAVTVEQRLTDGTTTSEWLIVGTFYISKRRRDPVTGVLALECYDALLKANAVWTPSTGTWPRTMVAVLSELATLLDLSVDSRSDIPSGLSFVIDQPATGTTIREVLGIIAQAGGGNWIVTPAGKLRLVPLVSTANAATATVNVIDVQGNVGNLSTSATSTITGVRCTVDGLVTLIGSDTGIVIDMSLAPLIAADMADRLIGQQYQPFGLAAALYDPAVELGDYVRAGVNGEIRSLLYSENVTLSPAFRGAISAPDGGEMYDEYPYISRNGNAISVLRAEVRKISDEAIVNVDVEYAQNQSTTIAPTTGWSTTAPAWQNGYYIWQRTATTTEEGTTYSEPTCISGRDGQDGQQGPQGATGNGVSAIVEQYYLSTSSTAQTGGSWSTTQPAWVSGKYIWTRSHVTWTNGTTTDTSPVLAQAINGANESAAGANQAVNTLNTSLDQQEIFNRLTDNGAAQGLVMLNNQLYINASYINTGTLSVNYINFNDTGGIHYDVPNENDPATLLDGQSIVNGWIVNTSGNGYIKLIQCDYATPLRGMTVSVTFTYNIWRDGSQTMENDGEDCWTYVSGTSAVYAGWFHYPATNPFTHQFTVPNDANTFWIRVNCTGVKAISVSLSGTVTPTDDIKFTYAGLDVGKFLLDRDGNIITDGVSIFNGSASFVEAGFAKASFRELSGSSSGHNKILTIKADSIILNSTNCPSGSFRTADGKTVTVTNGFITAIT